MKRPLEYIAGGFVLGEVLALLPVVWTAGILAALTAGVCCLWKKNGRSLVWWLLPFFCIFGMCWVKRDLRNWEECRHRAEEVKGKRLELWGTVDGIYERKGGDGLTLELTEVSMSNGGEKEEYGNVLAYVDMEDGLAVGARVRLAGELELFDRPGNPGEFDFGKYYHALGIQGRFYGESTELLPGGGSPYLDGIYRLKRHVAGVFGRICGQEDAGVFRAMILGDKTELSDQIKDLYQSSGIAHLLAVSGLHVSMIGLGAFGLSRKAGLPPWGAGLLGTAATVSYGIMAGGAGISAGVARAAAMAVMQMAALCLGRTYDLRTALSVCAVVLLIQSPTLLFQAGFQLSFGAVLALGAAEPAAERWLRAGRGYEKAMVAGAVIQLATCPVILYHYFEYPPYGALLNLVVIPLMSFVLLSGLLGAALGSLSRVLGTAALGAGHYVLELYRWLCGQTQRLPWAVLAPGRPRWWQIVSYGVLWVVFLAAAAVSVKREKEDGEEEGVRGRRSLFFAGFAVVTMGILLFPVPVRGMEVTFLDVGQGDGICIRTEDMVVLVDGGSTDRRNLGEQVLEPFLKSQGISQVDYAVVSHGDQDHVSGLKELLEGGKGIRVRHVALPWSGRESGDEVYIELEELAREHGALVVWMKRGDKIRGRDLEIRCLYPGPEDHADRTGDRNEHSLLLLVTYGQAGILLTGDMSAKGEERWLRREEGLAVQILKAAHHGSGYSTGEAFLERVRPELAIISCGEGNRYGHPSPETLKRLEDVGIGWVLTQDMGAVTVKTDGGEMTVKGYGKR